MDHGRETRREMINERTMIGVHWMMLTMIDDNFDVLLFSIFGSIEGSCLSAKCLLTTDHEVALDHSFPSVLFQFLSAYYGPSYWGIPKVTLVRIVVGSDWIYYRFRILVIGPVRLVTIHAAQHPRLTNILSQTESGKLSLIDAIFSTSLRVSPLIQLLGFNC